MNVPPHVLQQWRGHYRPTIYNTRHTAPFGVCPHCCAGRPGYANGYGVCYMTSFHRWGLPPDKVMVIGDCSACGGEWRHVVDKYRTEE